MTRPKMSNTALNAIVAASRLMWSGEPAPTYATMLERCGEEYTEAFDWRWHELTSFHLAGKP